MPDATALGASDGRVYVGTSHGSIFEMGAPDVELSRGRHRRIDQISSIPGTPYMACMADGYVSVSTPASLDTPTSLPLSHGASFLVAGSWLEAHSAETPTATSTSQRALGLRSMDEVAREKQKAPSTHRYITTQRRRRHAIASIDTSAFCLSLIHISEPTRHSAISRMPSSA